MPERPFLLAAALADPRPQPDPGWWTAQAHAAEAAGLDFVTIEAGPLDALLVAARLAVLTERIGIVAAATTTVTEPFHVSTAIATIDVVARGRAGWLAEVAPDRAVADGLVTWDVGDDLHGDAVEHVEAVRRLWDSWEEGAEIRDGATDRFIDRDRVHHVDFRGEHLAVRGPSITPRPPQGHPPVLARTAGLGADVLLTRDATELAGPHTLLEVAVGAGTAAEAVEAARAAGFAGVLLHAPPGADLGPLLATLPARDAVPPPSSTLRDRLGLPAATNRYTSVSA
jgi:alkanesulfonate monooxygenase SsuD/methylene tetrahydromethanopterin reductase-like flavin-dependent oxidoreductase (luciferase family)